MLLLAIEADIPYKDEQQSINDSFKSWTEEDYSFLLQAVAKIAPKNKNLVMLTYCSWDQCSMVKNTLKLHDFAYTEVIFYYKYGTFVYSGYFFASDAYDSSSKLIRAIEIAVLAIRDITNYPWSYK